MIFKRWGRVGQGGSKYYSHYKMTHPNCRIQDVTSLALFVHLHLTILFPCLYYIKLLVGEGGGGGGLGGGGRGRGGQNIMAMIK